MARASGGGAVVQVKVTLRGVRPPVWRRLVMPGAMTLGQLHGAIQTAMGWLSGHLHVFEIGGQSYGDRQSVDDVADERRLTLNGVRQSGVAKFRYVYDFGDDWDHTIAFEPCSQPAAGITHPVCIGGKRNCPPEDCGGVDGYEELVAIMADPAHPEHDEQLEWIGGAFDPEAFDLDDINRRLTNQFGKK